MLDGQETELEIIDHPAAEMSVSINIRDTKEPPLSFNYANSVLCLYVFFVFHVLRLDALTFAFPQQRDYSCVWEEVNVSRLNILLPLPCQEFTGV